VNRSSWVEEEMEDDDMTAATPTRRKMRRMEDTRGRHNDDVLFKNDLEDVIFGIVSMLCVCRKVRDFILRRSDFMS